MINSKLLLLGERTLYAFTESKMRIGVCKCAFLPLLNAFDRRFQQTFEWMGNSWNSSWTFEHRLCFNLPNFRRNFEVANQVLKG